MGFGVALTPFNLMMAVAGVLVGILIGALPGVGPPSGVAMLLPLTFGMDPTSGIIMLAALYLAILVRYLGRHRWWVTLSVALGAAAVNWLVFVHWLHVPMPEGVIWTF